MIQKSFIFIIHGLYSWFIILCEFLLDLLQTFIILIFILSISLYIFEKESRYEDALKKENKTPVIHHYSGL